MPAQLVFDFPSFFCVTYTSSPPLVNGHEDAPLLATWQDVSSYGNCRRVWVWNQEAARVALFLIAVPLPTEEYYH